MQYVCRWFPSSSNKQRRRMLLPALMYYSSLSRCITCMYVRMSVARSEHTFCVLHLALQGFDCIEMIHCYVNRFLSQSFDKYLQFHTYVHRILTTLFASSSQPFDYSHTYQLCRKREAGKTKQLVYASTTLLYTIGACIRTCAHARHTVRTVHQAYCQVIFRTC